MKGDLYLNWFAFIGNVLCVKIHIYVFVVYGWNYVGTIFHIILYPIPQQYSTKYSIYIHPLGTWLFPSIP